MAGVIKQILGEETEFHAGDKLAITEGGKKLLKKRIADLERKLANHRYAIFKESPTVVADLKKFNKLGVKLQEQEFNPDAIGDEDGIELVFVLDEGDDFDTFYFEKVLRRMGYEIAGDTLMTKDIGQDRITICFADY